MATMKEINIEEFIGQWHEEYNEWLQCLRDHNRMYSALLEIKRLHENENGKFEYGHTDIYKLACRGLGK